MSPFVLGWRGKWHSSSVVFIKGQVATKSPEVGMIMTGVLPPRKAPCAYGDTNPFVADRGALGELPRPSGRGITGPW